MMLSQLSHTKDGGFVLAGSTISYITPYSDSLLVKTDAHGVVEWLRIYGGPGIDKILSVIQTADGGFALCGWTNSFGKGEEDFWLVKTDAHGFLEWNRTYGGVLGEWANGIIQTVDGGFMLIGSTTSFGAVASDAWLMKTDSHGVLQWNQLYGDVLRQWNRFVGVSWDEVHTIIQTADSGFVFAELTDTSWNHRDAWLVKTNAYGVVQWYQIYGGPEDDEAHAVIQTANGEFVLAGFTQSFGDGSRDAWLLKTGPQGTPTPSRFISNLIAFLIFPTVAVLRNWKNPLLIALMVFVTLTIFGLWKKRR